MTRWAQLDDTYSVSDGGMVRNDKTGRVWPGTKYSGRYYYLRHKADRSATVVGRLVWEAFVGPVPDTECIRYKNGDTFDNRLENLQAAPYGAPHKEVIDLATGEIYESVSALLAAGHSKHKGNLRFVDYKPGTDYTLRITSMAGRGKKRVMHKETRIIFESVTEAIKWVGYPDKYYKRKDEFIELDHPTPPDSDYA